MAPEAPLHIALIVADAEGLDLYLKRFKVTNVILHPFESLQKLMDSPTKENSFNGLVCDMKTLLRATASEKNFLEEVLEVQMPIVKFSRPGLKLDAVAEKILQSQWDSFIKECEVAGPRGVRTFPRRKCILKIQICAGATWDAAKSARTVTGDLSTGGLFIISPYSWKEATHVSFLLGDMPEPFVGVMRWERAWGSSLWHLPGFGIEFSNLTAVNKAALQKIMEMVSKGGG